MNEQAFLSFWSSSIFRQKMKISSTLGLQYWQVHISHWISCFPRCGSLSRVIANSYNIACHLQMISLWFCDKQITVVTPVLFSSSNVQLFSFLPLGSLWRHKRYFDAHMGNFPWRTYGVKSVFSLFTKHAESFHGGTNVPLGFWNCEKTSLAAWSNMFVCCLKLHCRTMQLSLNQRTFFAWIEFSSDESSPQAEGTLYFWSRLCLQLHSSPAFQNNQLSV